MDYEDLNHTALFRGAQPEEIRTMMDCLQAETRIYERGEAIFHAGDVTTCMGMVLRGSVTVEYDDLWGNRSLLNRLGPGDIFAETYSCLPGEPLMVNVTAVEKTEILLMNAGKMMTVCPHSCTHHQRLIRNLLEISARKNLNLSRRILHTSAKTIRGRLISYLSFQAAGHGGAEFDIPLDRQQLADYLGVDRSALSNELSKMRKEGLLEVRRNHFRILQGTQFRQDR